MECPPPILYFEDSHLLVLSKPPGLLSQGDASGRPHLVGWLQEYLGRPYVGLVHRLDFGTSGLMVVAKRTKAARRLSEQIQHAKGDHFHRHYLAWVWGRVSHEKRWVHFLKKDSQSYRMEVVSSQTLRAQEAILRVSPQQELDWPLLAPDDQQKHPSSFPLTLLRCILETGRFHQIRIQAAHEGHPLLGDYKYHPQSTQRSWQPSIGKHRVALHASFLEFVHPMSGALCTFKEDLPPDLLPAALLRGIAKPQR